MIWTQRVVSRAFEVQREIEMRRIHSDVDTAASLLIGFLTIAYLLMLLNCYTLEKTLQRVITTRFTTLS